MDLREAMKYQLEASANQIDKVLDGLQDDQWDAKVRDDLMSPREVLAHLTECYIAAQDHAAGRKHEWGSYIPADDDPDALVAEMRRERSKAWAELLAKSDEDSFKAATDYLVLHDAYHVGQLAALRLGITPDWDPYAIYA
jgi:hypothetical protein